MRKFAFDIKKATLVYILFYFIIAGMYVGIKGTRIIGEFDDYTFPVVTILERGRFSIYEEDIPLIKKYFPEWSEAIDVAGINHLSGRFTRDGGTLAWYFPTYAMVCIPMIVFLRLLRLPVVYAFTYTNLFSVMLVLLAAYKWLKVGDKTKLLLIVLLSINPIMFYYMWPSGEVLIYSFLAIALIAWYNQWYKRAAFFVSLAGTLNITIMSVGIIMIMEYGIRLIREKKEKESWGCFIKNRIGEVIRYGCCYICGLVPMAYFYYHTGFINLTASFDYYLQARERTWERFLAYIFDLNFGILPYYPLILVFGIVLVVRAVRKKHWRYLEWFLTFIVNIYLYSVMIHINGGMSGIARYNSWSVLFLVFAVCLFGEELICNEWEKRIQQIGLCTSTVILALIVYDYGPAGAENTSYVNWTPIAEYFLDHFSAMYNPLHSTFNSRVIHVDVNESYGYELPIIYTGKDGYVRKILATRDNAAWLKEMLMSESRDNERLYAKIDNLGEKESYLSFSGSERVIRYQVYHVGDVLSFAGESCNVLQCMKYGFSDVEEWGTWTMDNEFGLMFQISSDAEVLIGKIECDAFNGSQSYKVYVNEILVNEGTANGGPIEFEFENPPDGIIDIRVETPESVSPASLGQSDDKRVLGLGIRSIIFSKK